MPSPEVSIVIPSYNEATYISRLLDALEGQSFQDFEVIVSDANSKDGTDKVIKKYQKQLDIKLIENPPEGPGVGRNQGATLAKGEWLLFLDADVDTDDSDFINTLLEVSKKNNWSTSSANTKLEDGSPFERFGTFFHHYYLRLLSHTKHPVAPGFCILTKRSVFEAAKGFDKKVVQGEDFDYVSRTAKHGFGFVEDTYYYVDLRRYRGKNGFVETLKIFWYEGYRFTHGFRIEKNPFNDRFGQHGKREE